MASAGRLTMYMGDGREAERSSMIMDHAVPFRAATGLYGGMMSTRFAGGFAGRDTGSSSGFVAGIDAGVVAGVFGGDDTGVSVSGEQYAQDSRAAPADRPFRLSSTQARRRSVLSNASQTLDDRLDAALPDRGLPDARLSDSRLARQCATIGARNHVHHTHPHAALSAFPVIQPGQRGQRFEQGTCATDSSNRACRQSTSLSVDPSSPGVQADHRQRQHRVLVARHLQAASPLSAGGLSSGSLPGFDSAGVNKNFVFACTPDRNALPPINRANRSVGACALSTPTLDQSELPVSDLCLGALSSIRPAYKSITAETFGLLSDNFVLSSFGPAYQALSYSVAPPAQQSLSMAAPYGTTDEELAKMQELSNTWESKSEVCEAVASERRAVSCKLTNLSQDPLLSDRIPTTNLTTEYANADPYYVVKTQVCFVIVFIADN
jgi:hypothetical protein